MGNARSVDAGKPSSSHAGDARTAALPHGTRDDDAVRGHVPAIRGAFPRRPSPAARATRDAARRKQRAAPAHARGLLRGDLAASVTIVTWRACARSARNHAITRTISTPPAPRRPRRGHHARGVVMPPAASRPVTGRTRLAAQSAFARRLSILSAA
jgi:hypothetical protein